jgi:hypothetical protein
MVKVIAYEFTLFSILISATQTHEIRPFVFLPKSPRDSVVLSFPTSLIKITFLALDIDNEGFFCYSDSFFLTIMKKVCTEQKIIIKNK